ncbi:AIG2-like protein D isoform X2 [Benincasa hispida]|uniref:AIG2-like protein D isoform X2 n=1 Tax=Benincasa hispida TaxID=102211 RepID=UPI0018FF26B6|nr:AIG2-like protein D isoform X2 [Benincasa hispida]
MASHQRFSVRGRVYPAILPVENNRVTGKVLFGITKPELDIFDIFEDVEYERSVVEVSLADGSEKLSALTYVWSNNRDPDLLYGDWNFEEWKRSCMDDFVQMTARFVEELELPEPKSGVATYESFYHIEGDIEDVFQSVVLSCENGCPNISRRDSMISRAIIMGSCFVAKTSESLAKIYARFFSFSRIQHLYASRTFQGAFCARTRE